MLVGTWNRLVIYLKSIEYLEFILTSSNAENLITALIPRNWGGKVPVLQTLQNVLTNSYYIVLHSWVNPPDVNGPFPSPQTWLTWLAVYLSDTLVWNSGCCLSFESHTMSENLCSGTFSTSLITNCSKALLFCNSSAFVVKSHPPY